ncbi:hypothetical protein BH20ACT24_BH20ACT24_18410 [soil metagenome]
MRLPLIAGVGLGFSLLPYAVARLILPRASPRQLAWISSVTLVGLAISSLGFLGALVAPEAIQVIDLPRALHLCIDALAELRTHPVSHWPSIFAAAILVALLIRLGFGSVRVLLASNRARPPRHGLPEEPAVPQQHRLKRGRLSVLPTGELIAYTVGVFRPQVVVSTGVLALDPPIREAILAHEISHAAGAHMALVFMTRVVHRAFGFIPAVRLATRHLTSALESSADEAAVRSVGDPMVVAKALVQMAGPGSCRSGTALRMAGGELAYRVRRLTAAEPARGKRWLMSGVVVVLLAGSVLISGVAWSAGEAAAAREARALALHEACHLPHDGAQPA